MVEDKARNRVPSCDSARARNAVFRPQGPAAARMDFFNGLIGPYIADFACLSRKLLVELDGGHHAEKPDDGKRESLLREQGYRVLRFWNRDVFDNCFGVLERIYEALTNPPPHQPSPAPSTFGQPQYRQAQGKCPGTGSASATPPQGGSD